MFKKRPVLTKWNGTMYSFLTVVIYRSASREHKLLGMLRRWQVPQSGPLPGLVCLVRVSSYLCCRLAAGQFGNHIYSNDQNGWTSLSTWHCWWYGWVVCLCSATRNIFSLVIGIIHQLTNTNVIHLFKCKSSSPSLTFDELKWNNNTQVMLKKGAKVQLSFSFTAGAARVFAYQCDSIQLLSVINIMVSIVIHHCVSSSISWDSLSHIFFFNQWIFQICKRRNNSVFNIFFHNKH